MSVYRFALSQSKEICNGRREQVLVVVDEETRKDLVEIPYDDAARVLLRVFSAVFRDQP